MTYISLEITFTPIFSWSFRLKLQKLCYSFLFSKTSERPYQPLWQQDYQLRKYLSSFGTHLQRDVGLDM